MQFSGWTGSTNVTAPTVFRWTKASGVPIIEWLLSGGKVTPTFLYDTSFESSCATRPAGWLSPTDTPTEEAPVLYIASPQPRYPVDLRVLLLRADISISPVDASLGTLDALPIHATPRTTAESPFFHCTFPPSDATNFFVTDCSRDPTAVPIPSVEDERVDTRNLPWQRSEFNPAPGWEREQARRRGSAADAAGEDQTAKAILKDHPVVGAPRLAGSKRVSKAMVMRRGRDRRHASGRAAVRCFDRFGVPAYLPPYPDPKDLPHPSEFGV